MKLIWITNAKYIEGYKIDITFNDGLKKVVDLKNHLNGEVFDSLKDIERFKKFKLSDWSIEWETGTDISPEFLYSL